MYRNLLLIKIYYNFVSGHLFVIPLNFFRECTIKNLKYRNQLFITHNCSNYISKSSSTKTQNRKNKLKTSAVSSQLGNHWLAEEVVDLGVVHVAVHEGGQLVQGFTAAARVQERALMGDSEVVIGQLGIQTDVIVAPALANFI